MKVLHSLIRWFKAKDAEVSENIEREHEVDFAKQDLEGMQKDLAQVTNSMGEVKATLVGLRRDIQDKQRTISNLEADAKALLARGKEELATKICAEIEALEKEVSVFASSIEQQEKLLATLEQKRRELQQSVQQAEGSLRMMQTMSAVARASEKIATVKVGDTTSALSRFKEREKRVQERLDKATAIQEMNGQETSLKNEVDQALGRTKGSEVLARLKQSNSNK